MNRRFSEIYNEVHEQYCNEYIYEPFQEYPYKRVLFEQDPNFYLNDLGVKKEEPYEFQEFVYEPQQPSVGATECLALTLKMPFQAIQAIAESNPLGLRRLVEKATRIIRREKAKLRQRLRPRDMTNEIEDNLKFEEPVVEAPASCSSKGKPAKRLGKRKEKKIIEKFEKIEKMEKLEKIEETDLNCEKESQEGVNSTSDASTENDKQQKKMVQMIRNRISAQNSRDRKKAYIHQLELTSCNFEKQNHQLQQKIKDLQNQTESIQKANLSFKKQLEDAKNKILGSKGKETETKQSFGKIGLTLLTLVSVYMMMGKCQEADTSAQGLFDSKHAASHRDYDIEFGSAPSKRIQEMGIVKPESCVPTEPAFMKQLEYFQNFDPRHVKIQMEQMMNERGMLPASLDSFIIEKEKQYSITKPELWHQDQGPIDLERITELFISKEL